MAGKNAFDDLAAALEVLPNIGPKSAQRIAYHLLQNNREGAQTLLQSLSRALQQIHHCKACNTLCEGELCEICQDPSRDPTKLMIVEMPLDVAIMEASRCHQGLYFILLGAVAPLKNADLNHIAAAKLLQRLEGSPVEEVIIATNFTAEGEATAYVLQEILKNRPFRVSRLAHGMPLGGELEFVDLGTIAEAFYERKTLNPGS